MGGWAEEWVDGWMGWVYFFLMGGGMGLRVGFININDMYNNDVGKGVVYAYETYEAKKRVAAFRAPVCFMNFGLIPYRHRYCTYLYYSCPGSGERQGWRGGKGHDGHTGMIYNRA